jgi:hypothetical protein
MFEQATDRLLMTACENGHRVISHAREQTELLRGLLAYVKEDFDTEEDTWKKAWYKEQMSKMEVQLRKCQAIVAAHTAMLISMEVMQETP